MKDSTLQVGAHKDSIPCKWCGVFVEPYKCHEEFDFYLHPNAKFILRKLREKVNLVLPEGKRDMDDYAVFIKLKTSFGVVMPGYERLLNAWKWMLDMEEQDRKIDASRPEPPMVNPDLPF